MPEPTTTPAETPAAKAEVTGFTFPAWNERACPLTFTAHEGNLLSIKCMGPACMWFRQVNVGEVKEVLNDKGEKQQQWVIERVDGACSVDQLVHVLADLPSNAANVQMTIAAQLQKNRGRVVPISGG